MGFVTEIIFLGLFAFRDQSLTPPVFDRKTNLLWPPVRQVDRDECETFSADNLPSDFAKIPAVKPGSKQDGLFAGVFVTSTRGGAAKFRPHIATQVPQ